MPRFEVSDGWCVQAFRSTLDPTEDQARALARHFGARRKAFDWTVATLKADIEVWHATGIATAKPSLWHRDFHDAVILECPDRSLIGKSFGAIADARGLHPRDAFLDVLVDNGERNVRWTTTVANNRPRQLDKLAADPSIHMGFSDAGAHLRNMAFYGPVPPAPRRR